MDGFGLRALFVDGQHQAAVEQLVVDLGGRGGEEELRGPLDVVLVRHELARLWVFPRRRDGELALRLQQLQRVAGARRAFFFDDGEHLVLELHVAHVEERLPGHRRVLHLVFLGHEGEHRFHQRRFSSGAARLNQHRERLFELSRNRGQVAE